jgi:hypothetical protein
MHNIAGNCNLQLLDGLVYLQGKRKKREGEEKQKSCIWLLIMYYMVKIKCLQYWLGFGHFNIVTFAVSGFSRVPSNSCIMLQNLAVH